MEHDPLCFIEFNPLMRECRICDLIARVREDERRSASVAALTQDSAVVAYAAALRDAVEAIKALPPITDAYPTSSPAGGEGLSIVTRTWLCNRDSAVAAIEALRGGL